MEEDDTNLATRPTPTMKHPLTPPRILQNEQVLSSMNATTPRQVPISPPQSTHSDGKNTCALYVIVILLLYRLYS
jgi:hypothetical protein